MENDFEMNKKLNLKKVFIAIIIALFLLVIIIELIVNAFKNSKTEKIDNSNPNSIFMDNEETISLNLSKKYELTKYIPKQNYLLELRSQNNLNIFVSKKDLIENRSLKDVISADRRQYIGNFDAYSNLSDVNEISTSGETPGYTYSFHYLDSNTNKTFYLQIIWIESKTGYYVIDIEFPLDELNTYSNIITETASSFRIYEQNDKQL